MLYTYVLPNPTDVAIEWATLNLPPDIPELVRAVPLDGWPLIGTPDVDLSDLAGRPLVARCGHCDFLPAQHFTPRDRVASPLPGQAFVRIARMVAALARGEATESREPVDLDPGYEGLMRTIGAARHHLAKTPPPGPLFIFEDDNRPGMVYIGTAAHFVGLAREGGSPSTVNPRRVNRAGAVDCGPEGLATPRACPDAWAR